MQIEIRLATIADSAGIAFVQVNNYKLSYAALFAKQYLDHFTVEEQTQDWRDLFATQPGEIVFVAQADEKIVGYALCRAQAREMPNYASELVAFHVLPEYQKHGIGTKLFRAVANALKQNGCNSLMLWTLKHNPVRRYYEALGGELLGDKEYDIDDARVTEVAYGWQEIDTLILNLEKHTEHN